MHSAEEEEVKKKNDVEGGREVRSDLNGNDRATFSSTHTDLICCWGDVEGTRAATSLAALELDVRQISICPSHENNNK